MRAMKKPERTIEDFRAAWEKLRPHHKLLCAECFSNGAVGDLIPLAEAGGVEPVRCRVCETPYEIPVER
jgi:hypothetical protein